MVEVCEINYNACHSRLSVAVVAWKLCLTVIVMLDGSELSVDPQPGYAQRNGMVATLKALIEYALFRCASDTSSISFVNSQRNEKWSFPLVGHVSSYYIVFIRNWTALQNESTDANRQTNRQKNFNQSELRKLLAGNEIFTLKEAGWQSHRRLNGTDMQRGHRLPCPKRVLRPRTLLSSACKRDIHVKDIVCGRDSNSKRLPHDTLEASHWNARKDTIFKHCLTLHPQVTVRIKRVHDYVPVSVLYIRRLQSWWSKGNLSTKIIGHTNSKS